MKFTMLQPPFPARDLAAFTGKDAQQVPTSRVAAKNAAAEGFCFVGNVQYFNQGLKVQSHVAAPFLTFLVSCISG